MLNDPPPEHHPHPLEQPPAAPPQSETPPAQPETPQRRVHPLEARPTPQPAQSAPARPQAKLHIPAVTPVVTYALLAANIAIFVIGYLLPDFNDRLLDWGMSDPVAILRYGEYHRLVTAMFLHGGVAHIFFNMLVLYSFGINMERIFGHVRFAIIYFLGGLGGSVASVMLGTTPSVGASAAIFAVVGAEFIFLYQHRKLLGEGGRARRQSLLFMAALNFGIGILTSVGSGPVRIDNWGHLGGLLGGLALAWYINPFFLLKRQPDSDTEFTAEDVNPLDKKYWVLSVYASVLLAILLVGVVLSRR